MSKNVYIIFISLFILLLTASSVVAAEDNMTDNSTFEVSVLETSTPESVCDVNLTAGDSDGYVDAGEAYRHLNEFRTENGVWYWNSDDETVTYFNTNDDNQIQPVIRDEALEQTAKIRAKEASVVFDHIRPDGSECFSAFPDGYYYQGENLAYYYTSDDVVEAWKEIYDVFENQGHRRNMMNPVYNRVGIAGYRVDNVIYWAMSLGGTEQETGKTTPKDQTPISSAKGRFSDLNDILKNANYIKLGKDYQYYNESAFIEGIVIDRSVTIDGCGHIIDGAGLSRIFKITANNVVLKNIIFKNAYIDYDCGGAVYSSGRNLSIMGCSFSDNFAYYGCAVYSTGGDATVKGCSFYDNFGVDGVVYSNNGSMNLVDCSFTDNEEIVYAAGVSACNSVVTLAGCSFTNSASFRGGAIKSTNSNLHLTGCSFTDCSSIHQGGAVYLVNSDFTSEDSKYLDNFAKISGGAIYSFKGSISLADCYLKGNGADSYYGSNGGAIYSDNTHVTLDGCNFVGNAANSQYCTNGGAVYLNECDADVMNSNFTQNVLKLNHSGSGGAVYLNAGKVSFSKCSFIGNSHDYGGAIFSRQCDLSLMSSSFADNTAPIGGAVFLEYGSVSIVGCDFSKNSADNFGGVIYSSHADLTIKDSSFSANQAKTRNNSYGGAIFSSHAVLSLNGCDFKDNFADDGGAIYSDSGKLTSVSSDFTDNDAYDVGGAIYSVNGNSIIKNCFFTGSNASHTVYGGLFCSYNSSAEVSGSSFKKGFAHQGGAFYAGKSNITVTGSSFSNSSADYGGAIFIIEGNAKVALSDFSHNIANLEGGAVFATESIANLIYSNFTANKAQYGGAVFGCNATGCTFVENAADYCAGAIYGENNYATNCKFIDNIAYGTDPACFDVVTKGCTFTGNRIIEHAHFNVGYVQLTYEQEDKFHVNLYTDSNEYLYDATVTIRIYKNKVLIGTYNFINSEGWEINVAEGTYICQLSVEHQDYIVDDVNVTLKVLKRETAKVDINIHDITYQESAVAEFISNVDGIISVNVDNKYSSTIDAAANGVYRITYRDLLPGTHTMTVKITPDNTKISPKTFNKQFTVFKKDTSIVLEARNATIGENVIVYLTASQNGNILVKVGNTVKNVNVKANFRTQLELGTLAKGTYTVSATLNAGQYFNPSTVSKTISVSNRIAEEDINISMPQGNSGNLVIKLPSNAGGKVTLTVAGKSYYGNVSGGAVNLKLLDLTGNNPYTLVYSGDGNYAQFSISGIINDDLAVKKITMKPEMEISQFIDGALKVKLPGDATGKITLTVNGESHSFDVKNGVANVAFPVLSDGNYRYTISYSGDVKYSSVSQTANVEVINPGIGLNDIKAIYTTSPYCQLVVYGLNGKPAAGVSVTVKVNDNVFKTVKTDSNGVCKFKITQTPGTYKLTVQTLGKSATSTLTVKHIVTLKSVTVKKSAKKLVLTATLSKVNGKYLKNKKVTFNFNGKKYTAHTDKKGVAKVTIKSSVLKKLKVGKKVNYQATYLKDTVKKSVKVKK